MSLGAHAICFCTNLEMHFVPKGRRILADGGAQRNHRLISAVSPAQRTCVETNGVRPWGSSDSETQLAFTRKQPVTGDAV